MDKNARHASAVKRAVERVVTALVSLALFAALMAMLAGCGSTEPTSVGSINAPVSTESSETAKPDSSAETAADSDGDVVSSETEVIADGGPTANEQRSNGLMQFLAIERLDAVLNTNDLRQKFFDAMQSFYMSNGMSEDTPTFCYRANASDKTLYVSSIDRTKFYAVDVSGDEWTVSALDYVPDHVDVNEGMSGGSGFYGVMQDADASSGDDAAATYDAQPTASQDSSSSGNDAPPNTQSHENTDSGQLDALRQNASNADAVTTDDESHLREDAHGTDN